MPKRKYTKTLYFSTIWGSLGQRFEFQPIYYFFFVKAVVYYGLGVIHSCRLEKLKSPHYTSYHVVSIIYSWNLQNICIPRLTWKHYSYKKECFILYIFVFVIHYTKDQLMIYIHEGTPSFLKRPLPTFKKLNLFVANNPLRVIASFCPLSWLKSSIPFLSRKIVSIFRRF